jgi:hypothetical protein
MIRKILLGAIAALVVSASCAFGQGQPGAGQVMGNASAAARPARAETVTAILDRAIGSTRGAMIERGASGWAIVGPGSVGLPWVSAGAGADPLYQLLGVLGGGTGINLYAIGDIICATGTTTLSRVADVATGNALISGGVGACPSYGKITSSHLNITATTCTNQVVTAISATVAGTCSTITLASAMFANQGTTTTVLHGNAAGNPSFGSVVSADLNITTTSCTNQVVTAISATASGTCSSVAYAMLAAAALATQANYYAAAANTVVPTNIIYPPEVTITYGATTTIDFDTLINGVVTLTGNITTLTLSNVRAGKAGTIRFIQDATGSRTWPAGGNTILKYAGGTLPSLSTTANAVDVLVYACSTATFCMASLNKDVRNP